MMMMMMMKTDPGFHGDDGSWCCCWWWWLGRGALACFWHLSRLDLQYLLGKQLATCCSCSTFTLLPTDVSKSRLLPCFYPPRCPPNCRCTQHNSAQDPAISWQEENGWPPDRKLIVDIVDEKPFIDLKVPIHPPGLQNLLFRHGQVCVGCLESHGHCWFGCRHWGGICQHV